jgi:hypothetical protein
VFAAGGSCEVERPPAEARWCPECLLLVVVVKLKDHRLKRGGVAEVGGVWLLLAVILAMLSKHNTLIREL